MWGRKRLLLASFAGEEETQDEWGWEPSRASSEDRKWKKVREARR